MKPPTQRKMVELNTIDINWYKQAYGEEASLSWILSLLLEAFRNSHTLNPNDYAAIAADSLKKAIENEM